MEIAKFEIENEKGDTNYYANFMEQFGITKESWIIFTIASLLQFVWGCETCFISINLENLAIINSVNVELSSFLICVLYTMLGFGSLFVGILTKKFGRIVTLLATSLIYSLFTILCSMFPNPDFYIVLTLRFVSNFAIGIFNIVVLNLMSEFLPMKNRCLILMINSGFYNVGNLFLILLNFYFMEEEVSNSEIVPFNSTKWRLVNLLTSIPGIISFVMILIFAKESPLYLLNKNREIEAFITIENISKTKLTAEEKTKIKNSVLEKKNFHLKSNYSELFLPEFIWLTLSTLVICLIYFSNMIGISYLIPKTIKALGESKTYSLSYHSQLIIYASIQLPNGFIGGWMTESKFLGRKKTIWISSLLCAFCYFISFFLPGFLCIYAGINMLFNSIGFGCAFIYVTEVFPTNIRDHAQSFIQFFAIFLGSWSPYIIDIFPNENILINYLILGTTCVLCAIISFFLPIETQLRPLDEDYM